MAGGLTVALRPVGCRRGGYVASAVSDVSGVRRDGAVVRKTPCGMAVTVLGFVFTTKAKEVGDGWVAALGGGAAGDRGQCLGPAGESRRGGVGCRHGGYRRSGPAPRSDEPGRIAPVDADGID